MRKAEYDAKRRIELADHIKTQKAAYFQRTYDPDKARVERKERAAQHAEYCRQPEYRKWKSQYDRKHRANKYFGEFAEASLLLNDIEREINSRASRYEIYLQNGILNKIQQRKRTYEQETGNPYRY